MEALKNALDAVNGVLWHDYVLYVVLGVGVLFTLWSGFCQYRALTHGVQVIRGKYDEKDDPGAINHFQALSAALSATVGLGNIGGVAVAIALGGPGAIFWMWMIGLAGMALKVTEVALAMLYRDTSDPANPHGGPMYVARRGFAEMGMPALGTAVGGIFCVTLLISTVTGGNMFQAWNVADITKVYFGVPQIATGIILAVAVGMVILGGIKRIGSVAGRLVPFMCLMYLLAAVYVIGSNISQVPALLGLIVEAAFNPLHAQGAFIGGTAGYAFLWGMKRALFSSESGQGSSPIAHSAAKTREPVREAVVAGLEPFIDTIVVCTLTALVILSTGLWNRNADIPFGTEPEIVSAGDGAWTLAPIAVELPPDADWKAGDQVYTVLQAADGSVNAKTGMAWHELRGRLEQQGDGLVVRWGTAKLAGSADSKPVLAAGGAFFDYKGATLTAKAFDRNTEGLGKWLVTLAAWLFALSTMISWSYYGEQGIIYLAGDRAVTPYRLVYCLLIIVATVPALIRTDAELDTLTALGTGAMLWANIPIMLIFGSKAMRAWHDYMGKLKAGAFHPHAAPSAEDVISGRDIN